MLSSLNDKIASVLKIPIYLLTLKERLALFMTLVTSKNESCTRRRFLLDTIFIVSRIQLARQA